MERLLYLLIPVWILLGFALLLVTVPAYFAGTSAWFGWGFGLSVVVLIALSLFLGELGFTAVCIIAFYGMWRGWNWEWWQAALVAFPGLVMTLAAMVGGGLVSIIGRYSNRQG